MKAYSTGGASFQIVSDDAAIPAGAAVLTMHGSVADAPIYRLVSDGARLIDRDALGTWYVGTDGNKSAAPFDDAQQVQCAYDDVLIRSGDDWVVQAPDDVLKARLIVYAADKRWQKETGGIAVAGVPVATDDRSKQMIIGARVAANADPNWTTQWVGADGDIYPIDAAAIIVISDAVQAHVNACFATFAVVRSDIDSGAIVDEAGVDAAFAG